MNYEGLVNQMIAQPYIDRIKELEQMLSLSGEMNEMLRAENRRLKLNQRKKDERRKQKGSSSLKVA